jgi:5-methylthioadenosine/S-adenosylhomocysteine deaminase
MSDRILIRDGAVLTAEGWLQPGYVAISGVSISALGEGAPPETLVAQADTVIDAEHCAVLPGLINGHTHFSQTFMRGLAGGRPLLPWLRELIWPLQRALTPEDMRLAALLGLVENLRCGATHIVDHHKVATSPAHTDAVCEAAGQVGLRLTLARAWSDQGKNAEAPDVILADLERLFETWSKHDRVRVASGPLALWRCSEQTLQRAHALARRYGSVTHTHVAETKDEVRMSLDEHGLRPVAWLNEIGVLDEQTEIVHAVWVTENEIALLAESGATVVHCPVSNAVLGSGIAPIAALHATGVSLRLGTDGPASNDTQDIFETLKSAIGFARATTRDATVLPPKEAVQIATGGRSLAPGALADVIVVNLDHPRAMPMHDVDSALALSTHGSDVETVIVGGDLLMRDNRVLALDEPALLAECRQAIKRLRTHLNTHQGAT